MDSELKQKFFSYIEDEKLFSLDQPLLIGCSGGVDSMVLCHLLITADINFEVAHVNYGLRKRASDEDAHFVKKYCQQYFIPCHSKRVLKPSQGNVQDWARRIRYDFFDSILEEHYLQYVLTAHHFDDQIETFLLNFNRGSGLSGLTGIRSKRQNIRRPLLFARKKEILQYAKENHLTWREDETNEEDYYRRNKIRHDITPVLDGLREHDQGMRLSLSHLRALDDWLKAHFHHELTDHKNERGEIQLELNQYPNKDARFELYQLLRVVGFHANQAENMISSRRTGTQYHSDTHLAIIDRGIIRIREKITRYFGEKDITDFTEPYQMHIGQVDLSLKKISGNQVEKSHTRSYFDVQELQWPLKIRKWKTGEKFQPFGMYGKTKKVSDLLVQLKLSFFDKEETLVLTDASDVILWVIGHRRAIHAAVTPETRESLFIEVIPVNFSEEE